MSATVAEPTDNAADLAAFLRDTPGGAETAQLAGRSVLSDLDLSTAEMRGAWAGEIGQTQFLPTSYIKFAVDFDGSGKRDLIHSIPDVLASTANYLKGYGWAPGPYGEGTPNFEALKGWNKSTIYQRTIALFAQRLAQAQ